MQLLSVRLCRVGPFEDATFAFAEESGLPAPVTVVYGGGGVGKTSLLSAIACTRPGHTTVQTQHAQKFELDPHTGEPETGPFAVCAWRLGQDDPARPHPLRVASPNVRVEPSEENERLRRREQLVFDRLAQEGGFAFSALSSNRWFARQPIQFSAPGRTIARYDVRLASALDDASRSDLSRETKQALAYAAISAALSASRPPGQPDFAILGNAMQEVVSRLLLLAKVRYQGVDPRSFEPIFSTSEGRTCFFDMLPTRARHLAAFGALSVRTLWGAYPGRDPRRAEGVVLIDEVDLHQDAHVQATLLPTLCEVLPNVQWIVTTTSSIVAHACDVGQVVALRRCPPRDRVELYWGNQARTH